MKTFDLKDWNDEERFVLRDTLRKIHQEVKPVFGEPEWNAALRFVRKGIGSGAFDRDSHHLSPMLIVLTSVWTVYYKIGLRKPSMLTMLLSPLLDHGDITGEEVRDSFGDETAHLVECMAKVKNLYKEHDSIGDENFRKLLLSMAEDIRVIICMIADRYAVMKLLNHHPDREYRHHVTEECRLLYTPMSHRLGLYAIKSELEDMAVKYDYRDIYDRIAGDLNDTKAEREAYIRNFITPLEARLKEMIAEPFSIKGRTKSISSIWHKLKAQNTTLDRIYDLFAIRIIIDAPDDRRKEKALCWQVYSIVTDMYAPNPKRLKDWIDIPKSNGYESLHITVKGPDNRWVEVQIRTKRMDEVAEKGLAAHWKYKGIKSQGAADQVMASIREILENNSSPDELMKHFSMGLYQEEIFVFTPTGDVHRLPKGATVLDFAFAIHSKLGASCVGARVGNKNVKINYVLHSGDTVEILTSNTQTPKVDWLNIVVTSKARIRIKQTIKEIENREAETGRELLHRRFKNRKIEMSEADEARLIVRMGYKNQTAFFHALSTEELTVDDVLKAYDALQAPSPEAELHSHSAEDFSLDIARGEESRTRSSEDVLIIDQGLHGLEYKLAGCCHPIYGDDVVGFVSVNGGIRIHRSDCVNVRHLQERYPYRIVKAKWSGKSGSQYSITLHVVGHDDIGIVSNITSLINKEKDTLLRSINIDTQDGLFQGHLTVLVNDLTSLKSLIRKIGNVKGVKNVERIN